MSKPSIHRTTLQLKAREYITPNYIRLTFISTNIEPFTQCTVGANNKIFIPPKGVRQVRFPDKSISDEVALKDIAIRRTYTHGGINLNNNEMYMEIVAHGVEGPASEFAINAEIGANLRVTMKTQQSEIVPVVVFLFYSWLCYSDFCNTFYFSYYKIGCEGSCIYGSSRFRR